MNNSSIIYFARSIEDLTAFGFGIPTLKTWPGFGGTNGITPVLYIDLNLSVPD
jgi:hypothetical protein